MSHSKHDPHRLELVQAGKLEERHSLRPPAHISHQEEIIEEDHKEAVRMRPELIAIAIMVIVLIVLAVVGL